MSKDMVDNIPVRDVGKAHLRDPNIIEGQYAAEDFMPEGPVEDFFTMMTNEAR